MDNIVDDAEDGDGGPDTENDDHADTAKEDSLVGGLEVVRLPGECPASTHVGAHAVLNAALAGGSTSGGAALLIAVGHDLAAA